MTESEMRAAVARAAEQAAKANADMAKHEEVCGERYKRIHDTMTNVADSVALLHTRVDGLYSWRFKTAVGVLTLVLAILGWALTTLASIAMSPPPALPAFI
ncbi:MAG: hypothetical protein NXI16_01175 [Alphaproteobacteria bacterium]|nr:hypothetical protein [Alphaproteobacteria bacterium]